MSSTPSPCLPPSPIQSEKAKRYDRQLRLWGDHGQSSLERASICLVNATATGTEILSDELWAQPVVRTYGDGTHAGIEPVVSCQ